VCGVFGTFMKPGSEPEVERGLDLLAHRGPDGRGVLRSEDAVHGHVRLSLVDLSDASAQPFVLGAGVLSWVGEVWNHHELRAELEGLGWTFLTSGDTEVVASALTEWGIDGIGRLDGMFSVCWSDGAGSHFLARDRFGKIPLYVLREGRSFSWASERRAFGGQGGRAVALPPGGLLDLVTGRLLSWPRSHVVPPQVPSLGELPATVLSMLRRAVRRRLWADAPVCCLVSGGLDSSMILMLAREVRPDVEAFAAVLDPASEDLRQARQLCRGLDIRLHEVKLEPPGADELARAVEVVEVPSKVQAEIAVLCLPLAREIGRMGFKACLSGEAADELFGGYGNSCVRAVSLDDLGWRLHRAELVDKMSRGNFVRCNKAFMQHGVECRLPFMEAGLVDLALSLGKRCCPPGKGLLKAAAELLEVPREIVRREKETFQGGSGLSVALAGNVGNPLHLVHCEVRRLFGRLTDG
jgi:asparagine synthase (glutamine-hydrolysing)